MPLNGRDMGNLAYMVAGAIPVISYDPTKNRIGIFGINGSGGRNVNVTVNGIDNKDSTVGGPVMQLPLTAVQEFNISTQRFSAANGRSEGAAVNVITKSGKNKFHGDGYFFDTSSPTPQFERQQFGGDFGGPIAKDKLFFFGALERAREHTSIGVTQEAFNQLSLVKQFGAQPAPVIPTPYFDWRYNGRMDYVISSKHTAYLSYTGQSNSGLNDQSSQTNDLTARNFTTNKLIVSNFTLNSLFTSKVINAFTAGYQYWNNLIDTAQKSQFTINFPNLIYFGTNGNVPQESIQKKWQFKDDISVTHALHTLKFGVDYVAIPELGGFFEFTPVPSLTFQDLPSKIIGDTGCTPGSAGCTYPQGFATPGAVTAMAGAAGDPRFFDKGPKMFGTYLQDDWKVRRSFTLNAGLRWDKDMGLYGGNLQSQSRAFLLLRQIANPFASDIPHDDNGGIQPRIGFAWDLRGNAKHVIRGGYGLYFGNTFQNIPLFMIQQANPTIFATVFSITGSGPGTDCDPNNTGICNVPGTTIKLTSWHFGVDPNPVLPPPPTSLPRGATARLMDPKYRNPYTEQWNVGYTFEINPSNAIEVSYVHNLGLHEAARQNINPINPTTKTRVLAAQFAAAGVAAAPGVIIVDSSINRSRYDGLDVSYRRRMSKRFSINTSYVLARAVGWDGQPAGFGNNPVNPFNPWDPAVDFGHVQNDERHRGSFAALWQLPWGFQVAPIVQASSARAITPTTGLSNFFGYGASVGAAHAIVPANDPTNFTVYSTATSTTIPSMISCLNSGQCIEVPLGAARGRAFFNADLRLTKNIKTGDWGTVRLMFQGFDITNRANFGTNVNANVRTGFEKPLGFITGNGTLVPRSFRGEFGVELVF